MRMSTAVLLVNLALSTCAVADEEEAARAHTSRIPLIASIQECPLVSGDSHEGLWLGPGMLFKPGNVPQDFHFFFSVTDRRGGDSIQKGIHFTTPGLPKGADSLSQWREEWQPRPFPEALLPRTDEAGYRFVPSFHWKYHKASGKCVGIGHLLRHQGKSLSNHLEHLEIVYSVYDPADGTFSPWNSFRIKIDGRPLPSVAYGQRIELPNGEILLPFSAIKELKGWDSIRWCGTVRCRFDGKEITLLETSNLVTHRVPRGFVEPSVAEHNGKYCMTLRAQDGHSHVATSSTGLDWSEPKPWRWDNGDAIAMDQTMTKFATHSDGLFLVYTRITDDNENVFRHRAPLFIAQIDATGTRLIRKTETTVLANNGFPLGNFAVHNVSGQETWVTSQEWDRTGEERECANLLARIRWKTQNTR
jgi:hypothetical protein